MTKAANAETITRYRYVGVTDENTECDHCGKQDLKKTIVLFTLDADGNDEEVVYFGSTCAARALGRSDRGASRKILDEAQAAHVKLAREVETARACIARYADVENDERALRWRFYENHINAMWMTDMTPAKLLVMVRELLASKRVIIADAEIVGL